MSELARTPKESDETDEEQLRQEQIIRNQPLIALLESWMEDDEEPTEEEQAQFQEFTRGIDENRGERKLFEKYYRSRNLSC